MQQDAREQLWGLKKMLFFLAFSFRLALVLSSRLASFLPSICIYTHTHTHTGATGNSKFPFMLLIIGACRYFMRPCKPLNYCTLKCILTLLRDHVAGEAFHCWSEDLKWWTTKEHDLLIIFNCRIKMIMKLARMLDCPGSHHKVTCVFGGKLTLVLMGISGGTTIDNVRNESKRINLKEITERAYNHLNLTWVYSYMV